jgi:hypothetical protein
MSNLLITPKRILLMAFAAAVGAVALPVAIAGTQTSGTAEQSAKTSDDTSLAAPPVRTGEGAQAPEQYGRAGDEEMLEQMQAREHPLAQPSAQGNASTDHPDASASSSSAPELYGRAGDATLLEHLQATPR